jgi:hypothetical protein
MTRSLLSVVAAGAFAGLALGGDLKSGLQPGQKVPVFHPLLVTGPSAGEKQCPV